MLRYYQDEMRYLSEAGKAFAKAHNDEARLLNIGSEGDRDPYVERLFEGFAFLAARIRERLEDGMSLYTEALFDALWPHLLGPIPALSIVEFRPIKGLVQQTTTIARGTVLASVPVGEESTSCGFTTTQDVRLQPLRLIEATMAWPREGQSYLTMRFKLDRGADFSRLELSPLRLYFHADPATGMASLLHLFFTRHIECVYASAGETQVPLGGQECVRGTGLDVSDALLPQSPYAVHGFQLLQEYFAFRQKFWFIDLIGLGRLNPTSKVTEFAVTLWFNQSYPEGKRISAEHLRLFCTPVVNLTSQGAQPLRVDHRCAEYEVVADVHRPESLEVYGISEVVGVEEVTGQKHQYQPYTAFAQRESTSRWFSTSRRIGEDNRPRTWIAFGASDVAALRPETVSLTVQCTNGNLPHDVIREKMITQPSQDMPRVATFENLNQPTPILRPPNDTHSTPLWRLLSHLALSHRSIATRDGLAELLSLHDWSGLEASQKRMAGIRDVIWKHKEMIYRRACVRGSELELHIREGHFTDEGDLCLFGSVLSRVLRAYTTINSFAHLTMVVGARGERYSWQPESGASPLL